jgi:hypothetical protein
MFDAFGWASRFLHPLDVLTLLTVCSTWKHDGEDIVVWSQWRHLLWHKLPIHKNVFVEHLRRIFRLRRQWDSYCAKVAPGDLLRTAASSVNIMGKLVGLTRSASAADSDKPLNAQASIGLSASIEQWYRNVKNVVALHEHLLELEAQVLPGATISWPVCFVAAVEALTPCYTCTTGDVCRPVGTLWQLGNLELYWWGNLNKERRFDVSEKAICSSTGSKLLSVAFASCDSPFTPGEVYHQLVIEFLPAVGDSRASSKTLISDSGADSGSQQFRYLALSHDDETDLGQFWDGAEGFMVTRAFSDFEEVLATCSQEFDAARQNKRIPKPSFFPGRLPLFRELS